MYGYPIYPLQPPVIGLGLITNIQEVAWHRRSSCNLFSMITRDNFVVTVLSPYMREQIRVSFAGFLLDNDGYGNDGYCHLQWPRRRKLR